jgi:hypothetical protein
MMQLGQIERIWFEANLYQPYLEPSTTIDQTPQVGEKDFDDRAKFHHGTTESLNSNDDLPIALAGTFPSATLPPVTDLYETFVAY